MLYESYALGVNIYDTMAWMQKKVKFSIFSFNTAFARVRIAISTVDMAANGCYFMKDHDKPSCSTAIMTFSSVHGIHMIFSMDATRLGSCQCGITWINYPIIRLIIR